MLAEHRLRSLDAQQQAEVDRLWAEEAERRVQSVVQGAITPISGEAVLRVLRARKR